MTNSLEFAHQFGASEITELKFFLNGQDLTGSLPSHPIHHYQSMLRCLDYDGGYFGSSVTLDDWQVKYLALSL